MVRIFLVSMIVHTSFYAIRDDYLIAITRANCDIKKRMSVVHASFVPACSIVIPSGALMCQQIDASQITM